MIDNAIKKKNDLCKRLCWLCTSFVFAEFTLRITFSKINVSFWYPRLKRNPTTINVSIHLCRSTHHNTKSLCKQQRKTYNCCKTTLKWKTSACNDIDYHCHYCSLSIIMMIIGLLASTLYIYIIKPLQLLLLLLFLHWYKFNVIYWSTCSFREKTRSGTTHITQHTLRVFWNSSSLINAVACQRV